jgi:hypothetical protein
MSTKIPSLICPLASVRFAKIFPLRYDDGNELPTMMRRKEI